MTIFPTCPLCSEELVATSKQLRGTLRIKGYFCQNHDCEYYDQFQYAEDVNYPEPETCHCVDHCVC